MVVRSSLHLAELVPYFILNLLYKTTAKKIFYWSLLNMVEVDRFPSQLNSLFAKC